MNQLRSFAQFLTTTEIFLAGAAVAAVFVTDRALLPALLVLALYWPIRWLAHGRPSVSTPVDWPILFIVAVMVPVTLWATALPEITQPQVMRMVVGIGFLYALVNWTTDVGRMRLVLRGLLLAGLGLVAISPFVVELTPGSQIPFVPRAIYSVFSVRVGDSANPSVMAGTLALLLPVAIAVLLLGGRRIHWFDRLLALGCLGGMVAVMILGQARGALLGTAAAGLVILALSGRSGRVLALLGTLGIIGFVAIGGGDLIIDPATADASFGGLEQRVEIWSRAIYMIQDFSFTGVGMGSFGRVADLLYPFFLAPPDTIPHAHNMFLQVAVDLGIPGLLAWLAILLAVMVSAWQVYRSSQKIKQSSYRRILGVGLLASQVALMVNGLTDAVVWGMTKPAVILWAVWGVTLAAHRVYVAEPARARRLAEADATVEPGDAPHWAGPSGMPAPAP